MISFTLGRFTQYQIIGAALDVSEMRYCISVAPSVITFLDTIHWMVFVTQIQWFSVRCVLGSWLLFRYIAGFTV